MVCEDGGGGGKVAEGEGDGAHDLEGEALLAGAVSVVGGGVVGCPG